MNVKKILLIVAGVVILGAGVFLLRPRRASEPSQTAPEPKTVAAQPVVTPATSELGPVPAPTTAPEPAAPVLSQQPPVISASGAVRVRANQILATVNQIPITLKDLTPLASGDTNSEKEMDPDIYQSRLERAIEAELTFQAARSRNIGLNEEQQERLRQIRDKAAADIAAFKSEGQQWTSITPQQLEFEERITSALMLQQNLIREAGGPSPQDVDAYAEVLRQMLDQLRASANVTVNRPGS